MVKKWIQQAHIKKGALHKQLGIPENEKIPITYLVAIRNAPMWKKFQLAHNMKWITVTPLLKHRVQFALNLERRLKK